MSDFHGHLRLRAERRDDGQSFLAEQSFQAPFHVGKSYWDREAAVLTVQVVNPTAGILTGDHLETAVSVGPDAALQITTPSASRVFHMREGEATAQQSFRVERGGWLEFFPEPLVPHKASRFRQLTEIELSEGASLAYADLLMPGRLARGEVWAWDRLQLDLSLRIAGRLALRERFDQSGAELRSLAALAGNEDGACFVNLVLVAPALGEAGEWSRALSALHTKECWVGLSRLRVEMAWSLKLVAVDSVVLRRVVAQVRALLAPLLRGMGSVPRKF